MIKKIVHFSDLHIRLFKDHDLYRGILETALKEWASIRPDRIVFTGDLVHSKNQMTPELVEFVAWVLSECAKIAKTVVIIGNHDFLENNNTRLDALTPIIDSLKNDNITYLTFCCCYWVKPRTIKIFCHCHGLSIFCAKY